MSTKHLGAVMKINISAPHEVGFCVALTELTGVVHSFEDGFDVGVCWWRAGLLVSCGTWSLCILYGNWKGGAHSLPRVRLFLTNSIFPAVFIPVYTTQVQLRLVLFLIMCMRMSLCVGMYMLWAPKEARGISCPGMKSYRWL